MADIDFDAAFDEDVNFEADDEFEEALGARRPRIDVEQLRERGREMLNSARERGRERIYHAAGRGKDRLAEAIDNTATRIDDRLYGSADYLRNRDVEVIRDDFIGQIRKRPLLSAGIALGAGYLIGKATNIGSSSKPKRMVRKQITKRIRRALLSAAATALAAKVQEGLAPAPAEPARRRPRTRKY